MPDNVSRRQQLTDLMKIANDDQMIAMKEANSYLTSTEVKEFLDKLHGFRDRTVPGSAFDQVFGSVLSVLGSMKELLDQSLNSDVKPAAATENVTVIGEPAPAPTPNGNQE